MRAFIYTGGDIIKEKIPESPLEEDLIIAADSGQITAASRSRARMRFQTGGFFIQAILFSFVLLRSLYAGSVEKATGSVLL